MSLDNELLMLAGEDDDDVKPSSPVSPPAPSSPAKKRARPTATNNKKTSRKRARRNSDDDGEDDESDTLSDEESGEASEPDAPMDTGSSSEDGEDVPEIYPLDGKFKDHADKEKLMSMAEIDREAILADRAQEIETAQQNRHLRNMLKNNKIRKSSRTKSAPKKTEEATKRGKLDELKRVREERSRGMASGGGKSGGDEDSGNRKRGVVSDDEDQGDFADDVYVKEERPIELADVNRCRIGRTGFGKLCDYPGFEETVVDCFCRMSIYDKEGGRTVYRVSIIKGFTTGKPYNMLDGRRRTDQHLHICHGKAERSFPMDMMSDSPFTEAEFSRFKKTMEADSIPLPTLSLVRKKSDDLRALDSRSLTTEEVDAMIAKRNKGKMDSVNLVLKRGQLRQQREIAVDNGDEDEMRRIDREIQELDDLHSRPTARGETQMERIARLNVENRKRNIADIRKAEIEEKRAARAAAQQAAAKGEMVNPFMRVKTVAKFRHDANDSKKSSPTPDGSQNGTPLSQGTPNPKEANGVGLLNTPSTKGRRRGGVDDVIASMDIDIDI